MHNYYAVCTCDEAGQETCPIHGDIEDWTVTGCELCQANGQKIYEDGLCWMRYCDTCSSDLLVVCKEHIANPDRQIKDHLINAALEIADRELGEGKWEFDYVRRQILEHWHAHMRRKTY